MAEAKTIVLEKRARGDQNAGIRYNQLGRQKHCRQQSIKEQTRNIPTVSKLNE